MNRLFIEDTTMSVNHTVVIKGDKHQKIKNVLRLKEGSSLILFNDTGCEFFGKIARVDKNETHVLIVDKREASRASNLEIILACCLTKGKKFEFVLEKTTELGVTGIIPIISERTIVRDMSHNKFERWQRILEESSRQCGRTKIVSLDEPLSLAQFFLKSREMNFSKLMFVEPGHNTSLLRGTAEAILSPHVAGFLVLIGPEGGFSETEVRMAVKEGFSPLTLGKLTWRADTAPLVITTLLQYRFGNLLLTSLDK